MYFQLNKINLSREKFNQFCLDHEAAGAYASDLTYQMWVAAGGKGLYSKDQHKLKKKEEEDKKKDMRRKRGSYRESEKRKPYS